MSGAEIVADRYCKICKSFSIYLGMNTKPCYLHMFHFISENKIKQSILKEISPRILEGMMLKLKLQYFGHLIWRVASLEKTLMLGGIGGRRRGRQRMRWLDVITDSMDVSLSELGVGDGQGGLVCCYSWDCKESDMTERLNWTEVEYKLLKTVIFFLIYL